MFGQETKVVRGLIPLMRPYSARLSVLVVLRLLASLSEGLGISLFIPLFAQLGQSSEVAAGSQKWLGDLLTGWFAYVPTEHRLPVIALSIFALALVRSSLGYSSAVLFARIDVTVNHDLRKQVVGQLASLGIREVERTEPGKLMNTLERITATASEAVWSVFGLIVNIWTIIVFSLFLLLLSWQMTVLVVTALAVISLILKLLTRRVESISKKSLRSYQEIVQFALELLKGQRTIRSFGREQYEMERFDEVSLQLRRNTFDLMKVSSLIAPLAQLMAAGLLLVVLLVSLRSPGDMPSVLVFVFILYRLHPQVLEFDETRNELVAAGPAIEDLRQLLSTSGKEYVLSGTTEFSGLERSVVFDSVSFRYGDDEDWAIRDVSTEIPRGKTVALVGPSGSGKSTFIGLLLRLFDPESGQIVVDGVPLTDLDLSQWRERLAVAGQDSHIFNASLTSNIAYGKLAAATGEIIEAARLADAHDFITALPRGYDTIAGDQGVRLSGGQRQRVVLARAIVRDADLLILDEAMNALDSISEKAIHDSVRQLGEDRTIIIIAHRLSTIEQADHVIVLESGRIREQGHSAELLQNKDLFRELYELQQRQSQNLNEGGESEPKPDRSPGPDSASD